MTNTGTNLIRGGGGLLAQIFQHETDHLIGVLFDDMARNLRDTPPDEIEDKKN